MADDHDDDVKCPTCGKGRYELHNSDGYAGMYCGWCADAQLSAAQAVNAALLAACEDVCTIISRTNDTIDAAEVVAILSAAIAKAEAGK
jgi:hypothetical protein